MVELESPPLNEPLRTAVLVAFGSTYVTYFDILKISNCRLGSRGFARQKCPTPMADVSILRPVGRKRHSPLLSYSNIPVALKGVFSALNLTIRTSTLSDTHPHTYRLCLPTVTTRLFPLQVKCLPACIACTLREGRAGAADVFRLAHFVAVMGRPGLNEAGAGGE